MKLKQLEVFVAVADHKSFSRAAEALYLTQPTVSVYISSLEKELNAKLFVRNTKEIDVTEQGMKLYQYAREMLILQNRITELFASDSGKAKPRLVVAASTVPSRYLLPDILAGYKEKYPSGQLELRESDSARVIEDVANHVVDVGFTGTLIENKSCRYLPFYEDELVVIMPNTDRYRAILEQEKGLEWICREPLLMREEGSGTRKEAEKQLKLSGIDVGGLSIAASVESTETIKRSVKNGIGITIISSLAVREEIAAGSVLAFSMGKNRSTRKLYLVYNNSYALSRQAENLVKVVRELYPGCGAV
ncbi:LysR family transcriptional regulator [Schaedlerella arabinosiphila]|uniref:LysR family transcriptional regulator n=1 Tax=Schaedlerella arabinosiphila TaxID=2044587 RepID=N2AJG4_9FIRM|nr:selenium metabolism-associated LysR family transcriptional regulator [Schaedlerella arabinosiphila]MCI9212855.1 LysR family transcriptional regulator [Ruminococcus sp.]KAI4443016.1 HTH-type transcriptional activator CmpR [Schaedlerella arabinosiphila]MCI9603597.1 LysR family transcriptional regulator [Ruminococcus sp.]MCI9633471.1 LysR family transcriptional regulator [Ruminococcus sp.]NDO70108.1 LysR family transcriptional regulator [Schaedlerella arabinosiphila]